MPMISEYHHKIIMENADLLNSVIIYDRDFSYNFFGFKNKDSINFQGLEVKTGVNICIIDDCGDCDVPLLEISFSHLGLKQVG